jgi:hypothetical protein
MSTDKPNTVDLNSILEIDKKFKTQKRKLLEEMSSKTQSIKDESVKNINNLKKQLEEITNVEHDTATGSELVNTEIKMRVKEVLNQKVQKNSGKAKELLEKYLFS